MMLATGIGSLTSLQRQPAGLGATSEVRRANPEFEFKNKEARDACDWVASLTSKWINAQRKEDDTIDPDDLPGGRLVSVVVGAVGALWTAHNQICRHNPDYQVRARDAQPNRPSMTSAAARKQARDQRKAQAASVVRAKTIAARLGQPVAIANQLTRLHATATRATTQARAAHIEVARVVDAVEAAQEAALAATALVHGSATDGVQRTRHETVLLRVAARAAQEAIVDAEQLLRRAQVTAKKLAQTADQAARAAGWDTGGPSSGPPGVPDLRAPRPRHTIA